MAYLLKTKAGMYRAKAGAAFPWTENPDEAVRFDTIDKARAEAMSHAAFMARNVSDYMVECAWTGKPYSATIGGRIVEQAPGEPGADF